MQLRAGTHEAARRELVAKNPGGDVGGQLDGHRGKELPGGDAGGQLDGHRGKETRSEEIDEEVEEDEGISWAI